MKNYIVIMLFAFCSCSGQKIEEQNIKNLVSTIDNASISMKFNYIATYTIDAKSLDIINLKSRSKFNYLIENLNDPHKVIISHILLTSILEPNNDSCTIENVLDKEGNITSIIVIFNKLKCEYFNNELKAVDYNTKDLQNYWKSKI
jgi:hypothetical protein